MKPDDYPVQITLPVQWGDQDAFGHVNNTKPIRWFESARIAYLEQAGMAQLMDGQGLGPILASITCNYRRQIHYPTQVLITARIPRIGRTSMVMEHAVFQGDQRLHAADGESVVVMFDYQRQTPSRVPDDVRQRIEQFEGRT